MENQSTRALAGQWLDAVPSVLTLTGLAFSMWFLVFGPWWAGLLGLFFDVLDGDVARRFGLVTPLGAELDWAVDCACAAVAAWQLWLPLLPFVVCGQSLARVYSVRVSGRAALFALLMGVRVVTG